MFLFQVDITAFALLFSEIVQYSQDRVQSVPELQTRYVRWKRCQLKKILERGQERQIYVNRLANLGYQVGIKILDLLVLREKQQYRRETKLINMLTFIKTSVWKNLFGKEADKLERANDDERTCENQANNCYKLFA